MIEQIITDLKKARITMFHIETQDINYCCEFNLVDLAEYETFFTIDSLEFYKTDRIERTEDIDSIDYIFKYENATLTLSAIY